MSRADRESCGFYHHSIRIRIKTHWRKSRPRQLQRFYHHSIRIRIKTSCSSDPHWGRKFYHHSIRIRKCFLYFKVCMFWEVLLNLQAVTDTLYRCLRRTNGGGYHDWQKNCSTWKSFKVIFYALYWRIRCSEKVKQVRLSTSKIVLWLIDTIKKIR